MHQQSTNVQLPYIPEFADHMEAGRYTSTFDLSAHLSALNRGTATHFFTLRRGDDPFYPPHHPDFFPLAAILFKANAESCDLCNKIESELARYEANMRLLYQDFAFKHLALVYKYGGLEEAQESLGPDLLESGLALGEFVDNAENEEPREGYLTEIFRFWRRYATIEERRPYEEVWSFVAGRKLPNME